MRHPRLVLLAILFLTVPSGLAGCNRFTKECADTEVYGTLQERRRVVPDVVGHMDVDVADRVAEARRTKRSWRLTLEDALKLAAASSRSYLRQREETYLAALDLTGVRHEYDSIFGAAFGLEGRATNDEVTPQGSVAGSASRQFENGASVVLDLASGFFASLLSGDPFDFARSVLSADVRIPLARGKGWVAREPLTQAERDVLYALRTYARFQQQFTVDISSDYYRLLETRDSWHNAELTQQSLARLLSQQEANLEAGRVPNFEVDQTRQRLLEADSSVLDARTRFEGSLDGFKLTLGIPVDVEVELPEENLVALREEGPRPVPVEEETAVRVALERRLDLRNVVDAEEDALRQTLVAKDALGPQVDLVLNQATTRNVGVRGAFDHLDLDLLVGLELDLPVERTAERNAFRASLIQAMRARRQREALEDQVTFDVREAERQLERARQSYEIEAQAVKLAEARVDSTDQLLEAGRATTRDRLDAETALVTARNALTRALVDHAIARLVLLSDVGVLQVGSDGLWVEPLRRPNASATPNVPEKAPEGGAAAAMNGAEAPDRG